jgi:benzodiazapine receptor
MFVNSISSGEDNNQIRISEEFKLRIQPAGYAFAIWGVIYLFLAIFVVYQAVPCDTRIRNDDLIFNKIGYVFSINMFFNGMWLLIFNQYSLAAFYLSCAVIFILLGTSFYMMAVITRTKMANFFEIIGLYVGFSMYAGWITTATVLNIMFCVKGSGFSEDLMDIDESEIACYTLWAITIIYVVVSYLESNVVYALIWVWASIAI